MSSASSSRGAERDDVRQGLPFEVMKEIASYLSDPYTLCQLACTCRTLLDFIVMNGGDDIIGDSVDDALKGGRRWKKNSDGVMVEGSNGGEVERCEVDDDNDIWKRLYWKRWETSSSRSLQCGMRMNAKRRGESSSSSSSPPRSLFYEEYSRRHSLDRRARRAVHDMATRLRSMNESEGGDVDWTQLVSTEYEDIPEMVCLRGGDENLGGSAPDGNGTTGLVGRADEAYELLRALAVGDESYLARAAAKGEGEGLRGRLESCLAAHAAEWVHFHFFILEPWKHVVRGWKDPMDTEISDFLLGRRGRRSPSRGEDVDEDDALDFGGGATTESASFNDDRRDAQMLECGAVLLELSQLPVHDVLRTVRRRHGESPALFESSPQPRPPSPPPSPSSSSEDHVDFPTYITDDTGRRLDEIAQKLRDRFVRRGMVRAADDVSEAVRVVNGLLFEEMNFSGNADYYCEVNRSMIHHVLSRDDDDDRVATPLTLAVIYRCVCRRVGIRADIIGLPGYVVVGVPATASSHSSRNVDGAVAAAATAATGPRNGNGGDTIFVDVLRRVKILSLRDCRTIAASSAVPWRDEFLSPPFDARLVLRLMISIVFSCTRRVEEEPTTTSALSTFKKNRILYLMTENPNQAGVILYREKAQSLLVLDPYLFRLYGMLSDEQTQKLTVFCF